MGEIFRQILIQRVKFAGLPVAISHWPGCESLITECSLDGGPFLVSAPRGAGDKAIGAKLMFGQNTCLFV